MRRSWLAALALAPLLAACPGTSDPYQALNERDFETAAELFEARLATAPADSPTWFKAKFGQLQALAQLDRTRAESEALDLYRSRSGLTERDVAALAGALIDGGAFAEGRRLLESTVERWPESQALDSVYSALLARMAKEGSPEELEALKSIGYTGGDKAPFVPRPRPGQPAPSGD